MMLIAILYMLLVVSTYYYAAHHVSPSESYVVSLLGWHNLGVAVYLLAIVPTL